ncbi:MAG: DCC1-like thiol-disulfide oxidoreductase family protein, partial [Bacteroidota bacterium]|nr:DCC1-like thiol-disulfide oxidoreductase family protein [Bacteroidota bacterium]MDX5430374.1 DCC1-like thiol-disulfide oxidoreductase family protein [Bacteroidota bacterium]MDX5469135.1 DCC1-like thiol-disulfide oxidoreductase family protein [Bacteroidota bacterium]
MRPELPALPERILFFDGYCHFCHGSVRFIQKMDFRHRIFFAPLSGTTAAQLLDPKAEWPDSLIYSRKGSIHTQSSAV